MRRRSSRRPIAIRAKKIHSVNTTRVKRARYVPVATSTDDHAACSMIARCGVPKVGWTAPIQRNSRPSRAIEKYTRGPVSTMPASAPKAEQATSADITVPPPRPSTASAASAAILLDATTRSSGKTYRYTVLRAT